MTGARVSGNRVRNDRLGASDGILVIDSVGVTVTKNRITRTDRGIAFLGSATGTYSGNLTSHVTTPYQGGEDAGENQ